MDYKICAHFSHVEPLRANGVAESNIVTMSSRADVLPSVGASCQASVLSLEDFEAAQAVNQGSACNLQQIGNPIDSIMVGVPVSQKWVRQFRYAAISLAMDGYTKRIFKRFQPQDYCKQILSCSVAPLFLSFCGCPAENGLPQKGFPFFSRVPEQLRIIFEAEANRMPDALTTQGMLGPLIATL